MKDIEEPAAQLDELISGSVEILSRQSWYLNSDLELQARVYVHRLTSAIERITLPGSSYIKQLDMARPQNIQTKFLEVFAIASGLRDDLKEGWVESVLEQVHADTYSDYLEMAEGLLEAKFKDAAAVITGTSLEIHVRTLCIKHGVDIETAPGKPKKADVMNADLKKAGVYDGLRQKQVTAWMDLRNKAAHGNYSEYDDQQVRLFIDGVRDFMLKYPA